MPDYGRVTLLRVSPVCRPRQRTDARDAHQLTIEEDQ